MSRVELTRSQREFIHERAVYNNGYRSSEWTQNSAEKFEIHHWRPVSWQQRMYGEVEVEYNSPYRLILLTQAEHHKIHPDIIPAIREYWHDHDSFKKVFEKRRLLMLEGEKYWVETWDKQFQRISRENTLRFIKAGNHWPERTRWV